MPAPEYPKEESMVTFEEFKKLEIKVAKILTAEDHPNADKLYVLKIDIGGEERQIVAGIKAHYSKESLPGKQIIVIANLQPAKIRGIESNGMLLAAHDASGIVLLIPERQITTGSPIS